MRISLPVQVARNWDSARERVMGSARGWIEGDESAKEMLARVLTQSPFLLLPPLHRVPLRLGNVVEIIGPSPSAKTHILIQAAISCILPKEWNGVYYGGLEHGVMFVDLDCRFDIVNFSQLLKHRINEGSRTNVRLEENEVDAVNLTSKKDPLDVNDKELYAMCLRRFLYVRCYDSLQFLATLKTMDSQLKMQRKKHGGGVHLLVIDSIGAFYWIDRAATSLPVGPPNRAPRKWSSQNALRLRSVRSDPQNLPYREYMPSVWQNFVTHRVLVRASDDDCKHQNHPTFLSEWLLPSVNVTDKFIVRDNGISIVP